MGAPRRCREGLNKNIENNPMQSRVQAAVLRPHDLSFPASRNRQHLTFDFLWHKADARPPSLWVTPWLEDAGTLPRGDRKLLVVAGLSRPSTSSFRSKQERRGYPGQARGGAVAHQSGRPVAIAHRRKTNPTAGKRWIPATAAS